MSRRGRGAVWEEEEDEEEYEDEDEDEEAEDSEGARYGRKGRKGGRTRSRGAKGQARIAASSAYKQRFSEALKAELVSNTARVRFVGQEESAVIRWIDCIW